MTTELSHIWLLVADMPRARAFYRDTLGIELHSDLGEYVEFRANPQFQLALFTRDAFAAGEPAIPIAPGGGQRAVLAFAVDALDTTCARLRAQGVELASGAAVHAEWGLRTAFLRDPDGNLICLYEDVSGASG
ncbi:MAG TPA: VOC family protein [Ktedonobacterales bacterium]|jgi:catechol 2,3-dioxygenase-like lactoylglutathione lyase family enzyme